jgi:hypothetical protein
MAFKRKSFLTKGDFVYGCVKYVGQTKTSEGSCCYCLPAKHTKCLLAFMKQNNGKGIMKLGDKK